MSLVVLGASRNIARVAQMLGEQLILVQLPGTQVADLIRDDVDEVFTLDFRDDAVLAPFAEEILRPRRPKAVVSVTERGLEPTAVLSALLGTPATPLDVVRAMRDKLVMRRMLARRAPHLSLEFADARDEDAVAKLFAGHKHVIVKPVSGTASEGVRRLSSSDEARPYSGSAGHLLEEYVDGAEYSVESFSRGGRHEVVAIVEKGVAGLVEVSHLTPPTALPAGERDLIVRSVHELLDTLGLRDGPAHTEVKVSDQTVKVIETHNRPGGDGIADLVALTRGFDWRRVSLGWPLGVSPGDPSPRAEAAAITYFTAPAGTVVRTAEPRCPAGVTLEEWAVEVEAGDTVRELRSSRDRVGWAIVSGSSAEACGSAVAQLRAEQTVVTEAVL